MNAAHHGRKPHAVAGVDRDTVRRRLFLDARGLQPVQASVPGQQHAGFLVQNHRRHKAKSL
jgi:hypothetical protein